MLNTNYLKNRQFGNKAPQIFCAAPLRVLIDKARVQEEKYGVLPTLPKTEFSDRLCIRKRSLTLLEIMIVIVLIGLIGSVIGFNVKGSLDEGKAFKTRQAQEQIQNILMLEVAKGSSLQYVVDHKEAVLQNSGLVKKVEHILKDGWGVPFVITLRGQNQDRISVESAKLNSYENAKRGRLGKSSEPEVAAVNEDDEE